MKAVAGLALLLVASGAFAVDFRNTSWLMTEDQVTAAEGSRAVSETSLPGQRQIVFRTLVNGFPATVTYTLENDRLLSASLTFSKDQDRAAFTAMRRAVAAASGKPSFEKQDLVGWRLERTEIALTHLPDGTTYAAYWEKAYFARVNNIAGTGRSAKD